MKEQQVHTRVNVTSERQWEPWGGGLSREEDREASSSQSTGVRHSGGAGRSAGHRAAQRLCVRKVREAGPGCGLRSGELGLDHRSCQQELPSRQPWHTGQSDGREWRKEGRGRAPLLARRVHFTRECREPPEPVARQQRGQILNPSPLPTPSSRGRDRAGAWGWHPPSPNPALPPRKALGCWAVFPSGSLSPEATKGTWAHPGLCPLPHFLFPLLCPAPRSHAEILPTPRKH